MNGIEFVKTNDLQKCTIHDGKKEKSEGKFFVKCHYSENKTSLIGPFQTKEEAQEVVKQLLE